VLPAQIARQMQPHLIGSQPVEIEGSHGFARICAQFFPGIGLGENAFVKRLGDEPAIRFLRHFEDQFAHALTLKEGAPSDNALKPARRGSV
jgi:hypothetical protein